MSSIRRIRTDEVDGYREVRLRALGDSPSAFATTLDEALRLAPEVWDSRTRDASHGPDSTLYLAVDSSGACTGMVAAIRHTAAWSTAELISMWVDPGSRGSGIGTALARSVIEWAAESGYSRIELWVTKGNAPAELLYRRLGFEETGEVEPLPSDPCKDELRMRLEL